MNEALPNKPVMGRRTALQLGSLAILGGAGLVAANELYKMLPHKDVIFKVDFDNKKELSFSELSQMTKRLDKVSDSLDLSNWHPDSNGYDLIEWAKEIIPQIEAEGAVDTAVWPNIAEFYTFGTGDEANHVLGRSDCENFIILNDRIKNKHSAMFESPDFIGVVAHELVHISQGDLCTPQNRENIENTAQIVMLETLAAMGNRGNKDAFKAFVWEFRGIALGAAYGIALKENHKEWYESLRSKINPGVLASARWAKHEIEYQGDDSDLRDILLVYNLGPVKRIVDAVQNHAGAITDLALPPVVSTDYTREPHARTFLMNDFMYAMSNLESMAQAYKEKI